MHCYAAWMEGLNTDTDMWVELGAVTDRSVRVWLRAPGHERVRLLLDVAGMSPVEKVVALSADSGWTGAVALSLNTPATLRPFVVRTLGIERHGFLAPAPGHPAELVFGFGSCHQPFIERAGGVLQAKQETAIYRSFRQRLERYDARLLLLIGDQIYADALPSLNVGQPRDADEPALLSAYHRVYRTFFAEPGFRALRGHGPALLLWDDHDILDNWGSRGSEDADAALFRAACRAYIDYQHSRNPAPLTAAGQGEDGVPDREALPPYPFAYHYGDIAFLGLDLRGARDVERGSLLGRAQWGWLKEVLAGPESASAVTLFVISTVPLAHPARWFGRLLAVAPGAYGAAIRDRWSSPAFVEERDRLLGALFAWQRARPGRQVCVLSGDIHTGGAFQIRERRGRGVVQQFISSAMTSDLPLLSRAANRIGSVACGLGEASITIRKRWLEYRRNYALVRVRPMPAGGHRVEFALMAWDARTRRTQLSHRLITEPDAW